MSTGSYGTAFVSPAEIRRREKERLRKLEEERLRLLEEERKRREREREEADRLVDLVASIRDRLRTELSSESERTSPAARASDRKPAQRHARDVEKTRETMRRMIGEMEGVCAGIPGDYRRIHRETIDALERGLEDIKKRDGAGFTTQYERLKLLRHDLLALLRAPEEQLERWRRMTGEIEELRCRIAAFPAGALPPSLAERIAQFIRSVSSHVEVSDIAAVERAILGLRAEAQSIEAEAEEYFASEASRRMLREGIEETLAEMGYRATRILSMPEGLGSSRAEYFATPDGDVVQFDFGPGSEVKMEFLRVGDEREEMNESGFDETVSRCRRWCGDVPRLVERLERRGVSIQIDRVLPAERGGWRVVGGERFEHIRNASSATERPREKERERGLE
ncbi:MAG: hypothetical protein PHQ19_03595 [Candidatus Krumholzibacteria bacterium]|nr:hypothetical protein [Candidatus Krumholzibacteria bacterium]